MKRLLGLILITGLVACLQGAETPTRPNVLWIIVDDMSANFGCYGEQSIVTPNVDRLAREGTRFTHAFVTAPVCSASRSALITSMYQTSIGAQHHRLSRGTDKIYLPAGVEPLPLLFQRAGYYTCIGNAGIATGQPGKTDYNFVYDPKMYDGKDWSGRKPGQPFFMQVTLYGGKHRDGDAWKRLDSIFGADATKPEAVKGLPPYYPHDPVILKDWAHYLDAARLTDREVGQVIARLEHEGLLANTLIIFMTDHGISHARGKQFLFDEGTHIPFIIRGPGVAAGAVRDDLIEHIDMGPISLAAAGIAIPANVHGRDVLAKNYARRDAVFAARDRCDETVDRIRSVRTDRWLYVRNFYPERPLLQPNAYKDAKPILIRLRELHAAGTLEPLAEQLLFAPTRAPEELYEWTGDFWNVKDLAADPAHRAVLAEMRGRLDRWMVATDDHGRTPETEASYDSSLAVPLAAQNGEDDPAVLRRNIAIMKQWAKEGK